MLQAPDLLTDFRASFAKINFYEILNLVLSTEKSCFLIIRASFDKLVAARLTPTPSEEIP